MTARDLDSIPEEIEIQDGSLDAEEEDIEVDMAEEVDGTIQEDRDETMMKKRKRGREGSYTHNGMQVKMRRREDGSEVEVALENEKLKIYEISMFKRLRVLSHA